MIHSNLKYFSKASVLLLFVLMGEATLAQQKQTVKQKPGKVAAQKITVKGMVTDHSTGKPLAGIRVSYGEIAADLTDEKGMLSVNYGGAALASAVELAKEVVSLRDKLSKLEALVQTLINKG